MRTLAATLAVFDHAGGGLVAGGLAYAALVALLPGLLLVLSVVGLVINDPAVRDQIVVNIGGAVPPLEGIARIALEQVAAGAVPSGVVAIVGLLWGASRFYSALDGAFARIFRSARKRGEIERTIRGLVVTALFVALPVAAVLVGSTASWLIDLAPRPLDIGGAGRVAWTVAPPALSVLLFVAIAALVYRFVPARRLPARAYGWPAVVAGVVLAAFTQVFTFLAPRLVGAAALYGTFVAGFALLAWLSMGFNVLLLGGAWTRVRALAGSNPAARPADPRPRSDRSAAG